MSESPWSFRSGHLALDFANTVDWHDSDEPIELLNDYGDLLAWAADLAVLDQPVIRQLRRMAAEDPSVAERSLTQARALREAIYRVFSAVAVGEAPRRADLDHLAEAYVRAVERGRLTFEDGGAWTWEAEPAAPDAALWPVAAAAVELLRSETLDRVGQCRDDHGCGALFIDTSRNRSRQWCRMESCGNRAKARRHYAREKEG